MNMETLTVSLGAVSLPYYAGESLLRMLIALVASTIFAIVYGYVAAKSEWAGKVMVPVLDILQSVPVLGFLSVTVTAFMALFPHSLMGRIEPSQGTVTYLGKPFRGVNPGVSMVFQSFALFPWLTVLDNVMLGLNDMPLTASEKQENYGQMMTPAE